MAARFLCSFPKIASDLIRPPSAYMLLCNCYRQLVDLNPLRGAPPSQGKARERIATPVCALVRNDMQNRIYYITIYI